MIFRAIMLQTDEIIAKLSLKFCSDKNKNVKFACAATDNINASLDI